MDESQKTKNGPRLHQGEKFLWFALGICGLVVGFAISAWSSGIGFAIQPSIIYTLELWLRTLPGIWLVLGISLALALGLLVLAVNRGARGGCILSAAFAGALLVLLSLFFLAASTIITPIQALPSQDQVYHLLYVQHPSNALTTTAYVVIECDTSGLACRYYATPLLIDDWIKESGDAKTFGPVGWQLIGDREQPLSLQGHGMTFPMSLFEGWYADRDESS